VDVFFCFDEEIVSSISAVHLKIKMKQGYNPPSYFLQHLAPSVKALALSHINADPGSTLWKFLDNAIATVSTSVVEIHLMTAFLDADEPFAVQPFRWVHDVTDRLLQEKKLQLHGRLLAYVPVLAKRGISMFDSTGRTLQDYMK
jgi:hypothetical protein